MSFLKNVIFFLSIGYQVAIWPLGIYLMVIEYNGHNPDEIARAMTSGILIGVIPLLWAWE